MELFSIQWSTWSAGALDIQTYFGDVYIPLRTIVLVVVIVIALRIIKIKRAK